MWTWMRCYPLQAPSPAQQRGSPEGHRCGHRTSSMPLNPACMPLSLAVIDHQLPYECIIPSYRCRLLKQRFLDMPESHPNSYIIFSNLHVSSFTDPAPSRTIPICASAAASCLSVRPAPIACCWQNLKKGIASRSPLRASRLQPAESLSSIP